MSVMYVHLIYTNYMFMYIYICICMCIQCTWCRGVFAIVYGTLVRMFGLVNHNHKSIFHLH